MFTGIIRNIGIISHIEKENDALIFTIETDLSNDLNEGDSVAVNGACLTVLSNNDTSWKARLMDETLKKTNLGHLQEQDPVNLERPLRGDQTLDGHFVQGHVDATCTITKIERVGEDKIFTLKPPKETMLYLIPKGSVTLNGVSLTVVNVYDDTFTVSIMPYSLEQTTFGTLTSKDTVNIEVDMIGKYVVSFLKNKQLSSLTNG